MKNMIGINEQKLDRLILDIYDYCDKINNTLNQITEVVEETGNFYKGELASTYRKKYRVFRSNFSVMRKNFVSYATDLTKIKNRMNTIDDKMTVSMKKAEGKIDNNVKSIPAVSMINVASIPKTNIGTKKSWR